MPSLADLCTHCNVVTVIEKPKVSHSASKGLTHSHLRMQKLRMESQVIFHK